MLGWLRKLFRPKVHAYEYTNGLVELAVKRGQEKLPCCGGMRRAHLEYRSGRVKCPGPPEKLDLRYNPLEPEWEFEPAWSEPHWPCTHCGCKRGFHLMREDRRRGACTDPDCPKACQEMVF